MASGTATRLIDSAAGSWLRNCPEWHWLPSCATRGKLKGTYSFTRFMASQFRAGLCVAICLEAAARPCYLLIGAMNNHHQVQACPGATSPLVLESEGNESTCK